MNKLYWYKTCPFCCQGRLFVFKNIDQGKLYLHCEECESGYNNPYNLNDENRFLTISENFEAVAATMEDILKTEWKELNFNCIIK